MTRFIPFVLLLSLVLLVVHGQMTGAQLQRDGQRHLDTRHKQWRRALANESLSEAESPLDAVATSRATSQSAVEAELSAHARPTVSSSSTTSTVNLTPVSLAASILSFRNRYTEKIRVRPHTSSHAASATSTPSATSNVYAPKYTAARATICGTGTLPKVTAFVKRSGNQIQLHGKTYRSVGPNIYWLGLDENLGGINYPSKARIREAMAIAVAMGANTVRSHTLGISLGNPLSVSPSLDRFQDKAFDSIDYAIYAAGQYGLRLVIPLIDSHDYYHGGQYTFLRWLNVSLADNGSAFFTDRAVIDAYKRYIDRFLFRFNKYSGKLYSMDPAIMAWETGNELGGYMGAYGYPPLAWTEEIATHIKLRDPFHLIVDGTNGFLNYTTGEIAPGVNANHIDLMSDHQYPLVNELLAAEQSIADQYGKAFIVGEYDWTGQDGDYSTPGEFYQAIEATNSTGDLMWSVFGHDDQCCRFVEHKDPYTLQYPNGAQDPNKVKALVDHWYRMTGRPVPNALPAVACPQPKF